MNPGSVALGIRDQRGSMAFKSLRAAAEKMTTHTDIHVRPSPETPQDLSSLQHKLSRMPKLTEVALEWDRRGWDPPVLHGIGLILATLPGLTSLQVPESLPDETVLPLLLHLSALQHLDLNSYDLLEVQTLQTVSQLTGLRTLTLHQPIRKGGKNLNWCSKLTLLQELYLTTHCTELSALSLIVSLQKLALKNYSGHSVESLSNLLSLEHLNLSGAACLRSVAPLGDLTKLVDLNLSCCKKLRCLGNLSGLSRLTSLNLHGCTGFRTPLLLSGMVVLVRLIYSNMGRHVVLQNNYDSLVTLTHLDLSCNHLAGMDLASECLAACLFLYFEAQTCSFVVHAGLSLRHPIWLSNSHFAL